jgi:hypothetical protein
MSIHQQLQAIKDKIDALKPEFVIYIKDQSVPLIERWDAFVLADSRLKEHNNYGPGFASLDREIVGHDRVIHMVRESTKDTCVLVDDIMNKQLNLDEIRSDYDANLLEKVDIDALKEEILAANCGSFTFDF